MEVEPLNLGTEENEERSDSEESSSSSKDEHEYEEKVHVLFKIMKHILLILNRVVFLYWTEVCVSSCTD